jgi:PncC family amidohydrolase
MRVENAIGLGLRRRGWRLTVAESCTGGLLGHLITGVPGSSGYFVGGALVYSNELKVRLLNVPEALLERWGAVSAPVALQMAAGALELTGAEVALSITGIAGPGGGTAEKPVGLTYVGLAVPGERWVWRHLWEGRREANKRSSARAALWHLLDYLGA